uniref:MHC class II antigen n=1 Tax=Acrobeloides nanus TaxID=290746 RepID=A0A914DHU6_9BILA
VVYEYNPVDGVLKETHVNINKPKEKQDDFSYIRQGDYLINRLEYNGVVAKRWYKKIK